MVKLVWGMQFLIEQIQSYGWHYLTLVCYTSFFGLVVIPFIVGLVVIIAALIQSRKLPRVEVLAQMSPTDNRLSRISALDSQVGSAFILQLLRKQRNEYHFHSVDSFQHIDIPLWILKTMLNDYFVPYTTAAIERVLVIVPPIHHLLPLLQKADLSRYHKQCHRQSLTSPYRGLAATGTPVPVDNYSDPLRRDVYSTDTLSYMDLSLTKYSESSQNLYKEKRPIHFKFLSNA